MTERTTLNRSTHRFANSELRILWRFRDGTGGGVVWGRNGMPWSLPSEDSIHYLEITCNFDRNPGPMGRLVNLSNQNATQVYPYDQESFLRMAPRVF